MHSAQSYKDVTAGSYASDDRSEICRRSTAVNQNLTARHHRRIGDFGGKRHLELHVYMHRTRNMTRRGNQSVVYKTVGRTQSFFGAFVGNIDTLAHHGIKGMGLPYGLTVALVMCPLVLDQTQSFYP